MVEQIMYIGIGFLVAGLLVIGVIPLVHARAVRLSMRRLEALTPLSMAQIQADKDQLRAELAMTMSRLEMTVEQMKAKTTNQLEMTVEQMKAKTTNQLAETFVDAFGEVSFKHGMIRIELVSLSGSEPRVMQRLIMSLQGFSQMLQAQNNILERLERAGVIRPVEPPPGAEPAPERGGVGAAAVRRLTLIEPVPQPASTPAPVSEPALRPAPERGPPKSPNFSES
jgi:hypothetical protein